MSAAMSDDTPTTSALLGLSVTRELKRQKPESQIKGAKEVTAVVQYWGAKRPREVSTFVKDTIKALLDEFIHPTKTDRYQIGGMFALVGIAQGLSTELLTENFASVMTATISTFKSTTSPAVKYYASESTYNLVALSPENSAHYYTDLMDVITELQTMRDINYQRAAEHLLGDFEKTITPRATAEDLAYAADWICKSINSAKPEPLSAMPPHAMRWIMYLFNQVADNRIPSDLRMIANILRLSRYQATPEHELVLLNQVKVLSSEKCVAWSPADTNDLPILEKAIDSVFGGAPWLGHLGVPSLTVKVTQAFLRHLFSMETPTSHPQENLVDILGPFVVKMTIRCIQSCSEQQAAGFTEFVERFADVFVGTGQQLTAEKSAAANEMVSILRSELPKHSAPTVVGLGVAWAKRLHKLVTGREMGTTILTLVMHGVDANEFGTFWSKFKDRDVIVQAAVQALVQSMLSASSLGKVKVAFKAFQSIITESKCFSKITECLSRATTESLPLSHRYLLPIVQLLIVAHCLGLNWSGISGTVPESLHWASKFLLECDKTEILSAPIRRNVLSWSWTVLEHEFLCEILELPFAARLRSKCSTGTYQALSQALPATSRMFAIVEKRARSSPQGKCIVANEYALDPNYAPDNDKAAAAAMREAEKSCRLYMTWFKGEWLPMACTSATRTAAVLSEQVAPSTTVEEDPTTATSRRPTPVESPTPKSEKSEENDPTEKTTAKSPPPDVKVVPVDRSVDTGEHHHHHPIPPKPPVDWVRVNSGAVSQHP